MALAILSAIAAALAVLQAVGRFLRRGLGLDKKQGTAPSPTFPDANSWIGRPGSLGDAFVGRGAQMKTLRNALKQRRVVVLSGGAGTGKSRLAAEYTHSRGARGFWTAAAGTVDRTLAALAKFLDIPQEGRGDEEVAGEVRRTLPALPDGILWVVDNLGDLGLANGLADATAPLKLLITTRDARRGLLSPNIAYQEVRVLDPQSSVALLCSRNECEPDDPALQEIAEAVGHLPLALEMLAVRLGAPLQTPERVLEGLREAPTRIEIEAFKDSAGSTVERPEGVFATVAGTLAGLNAEHRRALEPLGYLADAPARLPLASALTGLGQEALGQLLEECRRQSVLSLVDGAVEVHALTVAAIAATNPEGSLAEAVDRYLQRLDSINTGAPVALRGELGHHEAVHSRAESTLGAENPSVLSLANALGPRLQGPGAVPGGCEAGRGDPGDKGAGAGAGAPPHSREPQQPVPRLQGSGAVPGGCGAGREDPGDNGARPGAGAPRHPRHPQ